MSAPLAGLRVLELAVGVAGPFAGLLLALRGATVVKFEPAGGDPARELPVDERPFLRPSPVYVHLNAGKRRPGGPVTAAALAWADVIIADRPVSDAPPDTLVVTVTPGPAGDEELLVQAASGLLAVSVDETGRPLRFPGWQAQYLAGAYAAALALAGLGRYARRVSVNWDDVLLTAFESHVAGELYTLSSPRPDDPAERSRNNGHLARTYPSGVFACADGHVLPGTVRPQDWTRQCEVYGRPDLAYDPRFVWANRYANRAQLAAELRPWYAARRKRDVFAAALNAGWAVGLVLTAGDALADPHLRERGFFAPLLRLSDPDADRAWFTPDWPRRRLVPRPRAFDGLRVLELTLAWAGPLVGRFLAALGADTVRVEAGNRPDGWRTRLRWGELGVPVPAGVSPDECTWDASAQFNALNRGKRAVSIDLATPGGLAAFRRLLATADVLVVNLGSDALDRRGIADDVRAAVATGLVAITMPALGSSGPFRDMAGYGMLTEGMGGFAARYGHPEEPARASTTYYPDAVAGVHGVVAVLAALAGRAVTGRGEWIDLSQQETLWLQLGEGLVLADREGREPDRLGLAEPGAAGSGVVAASDGYVCWVDRYGKLPSPPDGSSGDTRAAVAAALRAAGLAAQPVVSLAERYRSGLAAVELADHPLVGQRAYLRVPGMIDGRRLRLDRPAPLFDQDTDAVLAEWAGLSAAEIAGLRADRAVGTVPEQPHRRRRR